MNEARSRELFLNFMNKNWNGKEIRQSKFNTIYFLLKNVNKELNCGIKHFDETNYEDWHLSFQNNKNQSDLNAFNRYSLGHLLKTSSVDLLKFNRISTLDLIDKQKKSIKIIIEVLSNNKILISNESFSSTEISLFDANSRKLIDNLSLKLKIKIQAIRSSQTLIAFDCNDFNQTRSTIVIVDHNLNVISRKEFNFFSLIGSSELNLFCMNHKKEAKCLLLDWSLNELERKIEFQRVDSKEPFYLFNYEVFHLNGKPVLLQLENIRDRLIVRTNAYHLENKCILIYSITNGMLLEKIKLDSNNSSNFKIDRQHELVCVLCQNNSLISLYNLDGLILEQIKLFNYDLVFNSSYLSHLYLIGKKKFCFFNFLNIII